VPTRGTAAHRLPDTQMSTAPALWVKDPADEPRAQRDASPGRRTDASRRQGRCSSGIPAGGARTQRALTLVSLGHRHKTGLVSRRRDSETGADGSSVPGHVLRPGTRTAPAERWNATRSPGAGPHAPGTAAPTGAAVARVRLARRASGLWRRADSARGVSLSTMLTSLHGPCA
jgi:hypothetical protein